MLDSKIVFSMKDNYQNKIARIRPDMIVIEVLHKYRRTEAVFKKYDEQKGQCIMCTALFESLTTVSERFGLNLKKLLDELEAEAV
jgi:hypothetical protein